LLIINKHLFLERKYKPNYFITRNETKSWVVCFDGKLSPSPQATENTKTTETNIVNRKFTFPWWTDCRTQWNISFSL